MQETADHLPWTGTAKGRKISEPVLKPKSSGCGDAAGDAAGV